MVKKSGSSRTSKRHDPTFRTLEALVLSPILKHLYLLLKQSTNQDYFEDSQNQQLSLFR